MRKKGHHFKKDCLLLPPVHKICIGIVFDYPWNTFMSHEKLQTIYYANFFFFGGWGGEVKEVYFGICASRELRCFFGSLAS